MYLYEIQLLSEDYTNGFCTIINFNDEKIFTLREFLVWFDEMIQEFDYSNEYFYFKPLDGGTVMYRKGVLLTKVTRAEYHARKLELYLREEYCD